MDNKIERISDEEVFDKDTGEVLPLPVSFSIQKQEMIVNNDRLGISDKALGTAFLEHGGLLSRVSKQIGYSVSYIKKRFSKSAYLMMLQECSEHELYDLTIDGLKKNLVDCNMDAIKTYLKYKGHKFGFGTEKEIKDVPVNIQINITDAVPDKKVTIHNVTGEVIDED